MLIPSIILIFIIIFNIQKLDIYIYKCKIIYLIFWIYILLSFIIGLIISTLYHLYLFSDNMILQKIGKLDPLLTAPIIGINIILLSLIYFLYLLDDNLLINKNNIIFILLLIFNIIGLCVHKIRKILLPIRNTLNEKIIYTIFHICFHYTVYTGILLLIILYYLNYKNIYNSIFIC